jgi:hypothetical protein
VLIEGEEATDDSGGYEGRFDNSKTDDRKRERERERGRKRERLKINQTDRQASRRKRDYQRQSQRETEERDPVQELSPQREFNLTCSTNMFPAQKRFENQLFASNTYVCYGRKSAGVQKRSCKQQPT